MTIVNKTEESDRIIYETEGVTITLWKDDLNLRFELIAAWPVNEFSSWQEYAASIEQGSSS